LLLVWLLGCSDDPVQVEWSLDFTFQSRDCQMNDTAMIWLLQHDDGTFGTSLVLSDGTQFEATDLTGRSIDIAITTPGSNNVRRFDRAVLHIERTPGPDKYPDMLAGAGSVERDGSFPCRDEFSLTGIGLPDGSTCSPSPDDVRLCATEIDRRFSEYSRSPPREIHNL